MHKLKALQEIKSFISKTKNISKKDIKRIYCKEYMLFFRHSEVLGPKYWKVINNPKELSNGDLIVFTSQNIKENHCMLVNKMIDKQDNKIIINVVDSSQFPHRNDTRENSQKGIGQGEISIYYSKENGWNSFKYGLHTYTGILNFARAR